MADTCPHPESQIESLSGGGGVILVALIIGGAALVAAFALWETRLRAGRQTEAAQLEEEASRALRETYNLLAAGDPEKARAKTDETTRKIDRIAELTSRRNHRLRITNLLFAAEANYMLGGERNLKTALREIDTGLSLMTNSGGGLWEALHYGRGRIRYELGEYEAAVVDLNTLLDYNPGYAAAYYWRAHAKRELQDGEDAEKDERKARNLGAWPPEKDFRNVYRNRVNASDLSERDVQ